MELGEVARQIFAGRPANRLRPAEQTRVTRVLGLRDVTTLLRAKAELEEVVVPATHEADRLEVEVKDVVVTARGSSIRAAVVGREHAGVLAGANLIVVRLGPALSPQLLAAYLRHPEIKRRLLADFGGSTTQGFTVDSLRSLPIEVDIGDDQKSLSALVEAVEAYAEHVQAAAELRRLAAVEAVFERLAPEAYRR